ncbi:MAG TPA: DinB family protein [Candidatus Eisenbacteria bacterium]|nr:DinB family protein [Candidatus Eisenbacteria bacterium]
MSGTGQAVERDELLRLLDQSLWANRVWIEHVYGQPDPEAHPRRLLAHIVLGECVWLERVAGAQQTRDTFIELEQDDLLRRLDANRATCLALVATRLDDVIDFTRASGEAYHARVRDVLLHLVTHGYHHRGQLAAHYARQGEPYPSTDHIDWLIRNRL